MGYVFPNKCADLPKGDTKQGSFTGKKLSKNVARFVLKKFAEQRNGLILLCTDAYNTLHSDITASGQ